MPYPFNALAVAFLRIFHIHCNSQQNMSLYYPDQSLYVSIISLGRLLSVSLRSYWHRYEYSIISAFFPQLCPPEIPSSHSSVLFVVTISLKRLCCPHVLSIVFSAFIWRKTSLSLQVSSGSMAKLPSIRFHVGGLVLHSCLEFFFV